MNPSIRTSPTLPGTEDTVLCSRCTGKTAHVVLASVDLDGEQPIDDRNTYWWSEQYQTVQCLGCKTVSFRQRSSNSEDYDFDERNEVCHEVTEALYPPRREGLKGFGNDRFLLPPTVVRVYDETLSALNNAQPVLAGIGVRALVELVCKEKKASGKNLYSQIDDLVTQQVLTPNGAEFLHKIRSLGNAAAHEATPHTDSQLALAMSVVEHLLQDVYILPQKMKAEFK